MVTVTDIRNVNYAAYDEVWAIVRSLKNPGRMKHVPELSPSWNLFQRYIVKGYRAMERGRVQKYLCTNIFKRNDGHGTTKKDF
ncbi:hypothetical protein C805_02397 [Eubacterium sp. 14-2]|jgi:hypothetical protein|uniref:hypothetical protein n=1 Tax=Eubacterium sp. 14-2 TaxID=1235790 RepID=UPI0003383E89|nr:hypothetical protein [Eubacterium sp. 14-2]EOT24185.1 hypothetical protein C805_02397 [Eubacterium sp. 14-2]